MINIRSRLLMATTLYASLSALPVALAPAAEPGPCESDKRVVAACFVLHGRLQVPANMRSEIWPLDGSKHLYAIHLDDYGGPEDFDPPLPKNVKKVLDPDHDVYGDFKICPFSREQPGRLQIACIASAQHLVVRKIPPYVPPKN